MVRLSYLMFFKMSEELSIFRCILALAILKDLILMETVSQYQISRRTQFKNVFLQRGFPLQWD